MSSGIWTCVVISILMLSAFILIDTGITYAQETLSENSYQSMDEGDKLNVDYQLISSWCFHQHSEDIWTLLSEEDCDFAMVYVSEICQGLYNVGIRPVYCPAITGYIVERGIDSDSDNTEYLNTSDDDARFEEIRIKYHNNNPAG